MSEDEPVELSASTSERFCFLLTPGLIYDSTALSLRVIREEREDITRTITKLLDHMSVRSPQEPEWQRGSDHLRQLGMRLAELGTAEQNALMCYTELGTYRAV